MTVTAAQVKELRDLTGCGMMDAKKALVEAEGDLEKAQEVLRQRGMATAEKKSGRTAAEGTVASRLYNNGKAGVMVEINCETDFVAKGDAFQDMVEKTLDQLERENASTLEELLDQPSLALTGKTVRDFVVDRVASIKENIGIRRMVRYERTEAGAVSTYIHTGGKIGVLLELSAASDAVSASEGFAQLTKDLSMQIASAAPVFVSRDEINQDVIDAETRVEMGKEDIQNKPEEIRARIVEGRVNKLLSQQILLEQPFVKNPDQSVAELLQSQSAELGGEVNVVRFTRFLLGEGIEREEVSFADEVAAAAKV